MCESLWLASYLAHVTCAQGGEAKRYLCVLRANTGRPTDCATNPTNSSILRSNVLPERKMG